MLFAKWAHFLISHHIYIQDTLITGVEAIKQIMIIPGVLCPTSHVVAGYQELAEITSNIWLTR